MPTCPICAQPLETVRQREGVFYLCGECQGRAVTISQIRHVFGDRMAVRLLRLTKLSRRRSVRQCPFCGKAMLVVNNPEPALELDACRPCNIIWVDAPSYETLPEFTFETTSSMQLQSTEIFAMERLKEFKEKEEEERQKARKKKKPLHRIVKKWNEAED